MTIKHSFNRNYLELKNNIDNSSVGVAAEPDPQMLKTACALPGIS